MKNKEFKELLTKTSEELNTELKNKKSELFNLRFQLARASWKIPQRSLSASAISPVCSPCSGSASCRPRRDRTRKEAA